MTRHALKSGAADPVR